MSQETELKYRLDGPEDHERLRAALAALGARSTPVRQEEDALFDTPTGELAKRQAALRLRVVDGGPGGTLTFKGPPRFRGRVKTRQEIEVGVADAARMRELLEALGYRPTLRYRKQRQRWHLGAVEVALDTLDFGFFCELEGPEDQILDLSRRLGLDAARAETATYPALVARHRTGEERP